MCGAVAWCLVQGCWHLPVGGEDDWLCLNVPRGLELGLHRLTQRLPLQRRNVQQNELPTLTTPSPAQQEQHEQHLEGSVGVIGEGQSGGGFDVAGIDDGVSIGDNGDVGEGHRGTDRSGGQRADTNLRKASVVCDLCGIALSPAK